MASLKKTLLIGIALLAQSVHAADLNSRAPAFSAPSLDQTEIVNSKDLAGKVVFVDFWASWCPPCLKSLPEFESLQKAFATRGDVVVLAINLDENIADAKKFVSTLDVSYKILADSKGVIPKNFGVQAMPSSYIIDKEGFIRYIHHGYQSGDVEVIKTKIRQLLL